MKKVFILFWLVIANIMLFAQSDYYWNNNQKVFLEKVPNKKYVVTHNVSDGNDLKQKINIPLAQVNKFAETNVYSGLNVYSGNANIKVKWAVVEFDSIINFNLSLKNEIIYESSFYITTGKTEAGLSHLFYVKLFNSGDINQLEQLALANNIEILGNNKYMPLWYTLSCTKNSSGNALEMANLFYETGLFVAAAPDWMKDYLIQCVNDTYFNNQWGLANSVGSDIKACLAWQTTEGSNNIIVAVLDHGIDLSHPDLTNIHPYSFDAETGTSPSVIRGSHGTACAGISGATSDNNQGIAGVAPLSPLMSISHNLVIDPNVANTLAAGLSWAWQNGASVISNSWGHNSLIDPIITDAINDALNLGRNGLGCVVVFATGNSNGGVIYPANSFDDILAVGAMSPCDERKNPSSCDGEGWGSNFGPKLDIMAPGVLIPTTDLQGTNGYDPTDYFQYFNGTSSATPHVAAVAALILSVNHNLTQKQVADIIESTAQKVGGYPYATAPGRPNGTWHVEMGYGLIDAEAAVLLAQSMCTEPMDLFIKDTYFDFGQEPNPDTGPMWISEDIWVRNNPDGLFEHQNPIPQQDNWIYVRVRNKSCVASTPATVNIRWAKAATALSYPIHWNNSLTCNGPGTASMGKEVAPQPNLPIPIIPPGGDYIVPILWNDVPDPIDYTNCNNTFATEPWHFCLLAQIISQDDQISGQGPGLYDWVQLNNNIAWKNLTVEDAPQYPPPISDCENERLAGGAVAVGNPYTDHEDSYDLIFKLSDNYEGNILDVAEVRVYLDPETWDKWAKGGYMGEYIEVRREDCRQLIVTGDNATIRNLYYEPLERSMIFVSFNFLVDEVTPEHNFDFNVIQTHHEGGGVIGGELYKVIRPVRSSFDADAGGDMTVSKNDSVTLSASSIGEPAYYNWYDPTGAIVHKGQNFTVATGVTTKYKLEVIALADGFIDYDSLTVTVKEFEIKSITPNPATNQVTVEYVAENAASAFIRITPAFQNVSNDYPLNTVNTTTVINVSSYLPGVYSVILYCDGVAVDVKQLVIL
ncbi:MAG: S8 family serine peptidase [Bacteroidia bacterium]